jgi:hypothetical protein
MCECNGKHLCNSCTKLIDFPSCMAANIGFCREAGRDNIVDCENYIKVEDSCVDK